MMTIALRLAGRGLGRTAPNPAVGAVIADEATGEVIARGWTQPGGRPHAETEALRRAGARARGKTMYVTLEPCSHHGKTPPCADAVIDAGLARVVVGVADPDPRVSGRGLDRLRAASIRVERGLLGAQAHWVTRGHIARVAERRPFVQLKMATDAAGEVPMGHAGAPTWVTGELARAHGQLLRARADAILIGRGTLVADDPQLTCRLPGLGARSPVRVLLAGHGMLPPRRRLFSGEGPSVWVFVGASSVGEPAPAGVRLFAVPSVGGRLWLPAVLEALVGEGVTRLLVEGGPALWRAFAEAGLVDEVVHYRAGHDGACAGGTPTVESHASEAGLDIVRRLAPGISLRLADRRLIGDDELSVYRRT
ncbi:MAG: bifunctional diaminohydroxyphosphoribosylaminopyrimidine deaminase/5-amino-6-(5-phosphoribosylamino)uracil reductase RibD [Beijerinckiaceae bacterium]|nr:bifunctional diaminohydroxyphosphoribosylaminopyrimidine deaminase/5-amino-6-(5-phosphoribosylamino)uracil reductase RibD [Beijerinckiaceae bacterium]